jgi:hypothetical protein
MDQLSADEKRRTLMTVAAQVVPLIAASLCVEASQKIHEDDRPRYLDEDLMPSVQKSIAGASDRATKIFFHEIVGSIEVLTVERGSVPVSEFVSRLIFEGTDILDSSGNPGIIG